MFKITQLMLNRKIKENKKNIGFNSQCLQVKYDAETNTISTSNIRSTRYKKYVVELIKNNLEANNLKYNENQLELIVIDDSCKYYEYKIESEAVLDEEVAAYELKVEQEEDERDKKERIKKDKETERKKIMRNRKKEKESDSRSFITKITLIRKLNMGGGK